MSVIIESFIKKKKKGDIVDYEYCGVCTVFIIDGYCNKRFSKNKK